MSVLALVSAVAGFVKVRYLIEKAVIDNIIFRCHYRVTTAILFLSCVLVTANNLIGTISLLPVSTYSVLPYLLRHIAQCHIFLKILLSENEDINVFTKFCPESGFNS